MATVDLTTTATIGASDTVLVTIYEDVGNDGTGPNTDPNGTPYDNADTITIATGTNTYTSADVFQAGVGNAYWLGIQVDSTALTSTPTISSAEVDSGGVQPITVAAEPTDVAVTPTDATGYEPGILVWDPSADWGGESTELGQVTLGEFNLGVETDSGAVEQQGTRVSQGDVTLTDIEGYRDGLQKDLH